MHKSIAARLSFSSLHFQLSKGVELRSQLVQLQEELVPLQEHRDGLEKNSLTRSNLLMWGGLAFMSVQFGFLARLTWWEYSWDIMEPVTFFLTYSTSMVMFAYFVITRTVRGWDYVIAVLNVGCMTLELLFVKLLLYCWF